MNNNKFLLQKVKTFYFPLKKISLSIEKHKKTQKNTIKSETHIFTKTETIFDTPKKSTNQNSLQKSFFITSILIKKNVKQNS